MILDTNWARTLVHTLKEASQEMANGRPINGGDIENLDDLLEWVEETLDAEPDQKDKKGEARSA